jgi:hypothetical protein
VSKQRASFEAKKADLLDLVDLEPTQREQVLALLDGAQDLLGMGSSTCVVGQWSVNIRKFLEQARFDSAVSSKLMSEWCQKIRESLDVQSLQFEYASLYSRLVNEWLANAPEANSDVDGQSFEKNGRKEMHEQRSTWKSYVFTALETDSEGITKYLEELFGSNKELTKAFKRLKTSTEYFEETLAMEAPFDEYSLELCVNSLLKSDLLTDAKKGILKEFSGNKVVLQEIADVLNMRFAAFDSWSWGDEVTPIEQRRQLNGRYRFYHDEDLLQSIFLRYIGVRWSVHIKQEFTEFIGSEGVWKTSTSPVSKVDRERRNHFLKSNNNEEENNVEYKRNQLWKDDVFLEQLQLTVEESGREYDDDSEPDYGNKTKSPQRIVQSVLHLLVTDILLKTRMGEDVTVIRSDFKWFGPSLPHSTIFAVLRFFGVSDRWINFFRRALESPMRFVGDGADSPVNVQKRGTPISGPLSDFLGESVLFCLDFAVNQKTNGARLFRLHDDIWFWGSQQTCEVGWAVMTEFTKLMGLEINTEKTGSVCVTPSARQAYRAGRAVSLPKPSKLLPQGPVRWGFLSLDAASGRFIIDQKQVDEHIAELRLQLDACKSVFDWIQVWNIYASRFFTVNFGHPAQCNGRAHVDMELETFQRIQHEIFGNGKLSGSASVSEYVKNMIMDRFGVQDIPEGYLYFPMAKGGLDLKNPFVGLYLVRDGLTENPDKLIDEFFDKEEADYKREKKNYDSGFNANSSYRHSGSTSDKDRDPFMSFEEYTRYREQTSGCLAEVYKSLVREARDEKVAITTDVFSAIGTNAWNSMKAYDRWIMQLYGSDMIKRFGGLVVVEKGLLPIGMVSMLRQSRFQWAG